VDVGGVMDRSDQVIGTTADAVKCPGSIPKVPGSRPGRPTENTGTFTLVDPNRRRTLKVSRRFSNHSPLRRSSQHLQCQLEQMVSRLEDW
jgi:hypothetical protein